MTEDTGKSPEKYGESDNSVEKEQSELKSGDKKKITMKLEGSSNEEIDKLSDAEVLMRIGVGRTDFYWTYKTKDGHSGFRPERLTLKKIQEHIEGKDILGVSPFTSDIHVKWGDIDIDAHTEGLSEEMKQKIILEAQEDAQKIYNYLKQNNYPVFMSKSGGSVGRHIRIFQQCGYLAKDMRVFLMKIQYEVLGDAEKHEIFPKQDDLRETEKHRGNQSKLFCGVHPKTGARTDLILDGKELTLKESIDELKNILKNFKSYKKIEVTEDDYNLLRKDGVEFVNPNPTAPEYCAAIEEVASKKILTSGKRQRHTHLDPNVDAYTRGRPEKTLLRDNYKKIQQRGETALSNWHNDWSCGKNIALFKDRADGGDANAKEALELCKSCERFKNFTKHQIYDLIREISEDEVLRQKQIHEILEKIKYEQDEIFINDVEKRIQEKTKISITALKKELQKINQVREEINQEAVQPLNQQTTIYRHLAQSFYLLQPYYYDNSKLWFLWDFEKKGWFVKDETDLLIIFDKYFMQESEKSNVKSGIIEALEKYGRQNKPLDIKPSWVQYKNIVYDVATEESFEATPKYFIANPINREIGKTEDTPIIDKLFKSWVKPEEVPKLYEFIAFATVPEMFIHSFHFLHGPPGGGKGTFVRLVLKFIGNNNACATSLDRINSNPRFETLNWHKKLLIIMSEVSDIYDLRNSGLINQATGQDLLRAEVKGGRSFDFVNYGKFIYPTNKLLKIDAGDGFGRRVRKFDFLQRFEKEKDVLDEIPEWEFENLAKKCLRIARELWQRRRFTGDVDISKRIENYQQDSKTPLERFIDKYCDLTDDTAKILFGEFYSKFIRVTGQNVSKKEISWQIKNLGFENKEENYQENVQDIGGTTLGDWKRGNRIHGIKWKEKEKI